MNTWPDNRKRLYGLTVRRAACMPRNGEALRIRSGALSRRATGTGGGGGIVHDGSRRWSPAPPGGNRKDACHVRPISWSPGGDGDSGPSTGGRGLLLLGRGSQEWASTGCSDHQRGTSCYPVFWTLHERRSLSPRRQPQLHHWMILLSMSPNGGCKGKRLNRCTSIICPLLCTLFRWRKCLAETWSCADHERGGRNISSPYHNRKCWHVRYSTWTAYCVEARWARLRTGVVWGRVHNGGAITCPWHNLRSGKSRANLTVSATIPPCRKGSDFSRICPGRPRTPHWCPKRDILQSSGFGPQESWSWHDQPSELVHLDHMASFMLSLS